jgi:hypothetical protein
LKVGAFIASPLSTLHFVQSSEFGACCTAVRSWVRSYRPNTGDIFGIGVEYCPQHCGLCTRRICRLIHCVTIALREVREGESDQCGLMGKLEAHLCDLVEGKLFIQLLIKRSATYFPLSDEVSTIFLQSHGTAKSASFLREDEVLGTLNIS